MLEHQNEDMLNHTRAYVNLNALVNNFTAIKQKVGPSVKIMGVIKANACGHGIVPVAKTLIQEGASFLAVARINEAIALRENGITTPILLFGSIAEEQMGYAARNDIRISVSSLAFAKKMNQILADQNLRAKVHIKIDTGMTRLGLFPDYFQDQEKEPEMETAVQDIMKMAELGNIDLEGIYTHFACADEVDKTHANRQFSLFEKVIKALKEKGVDLLVHASNSAAVIDLPHTYCDMVRPGIMLYGVYPSDEVDHDAVALEPVMEIRSKVIHVKEVPKGVSIGYGYTHTTDKPTRIATIPIGYADGYSRLLSSKGRMLVRGHSAPIVGRVCMDITMIDVGHVPGVTEGDEVVILGSQGKETITADEIAGLTGTIGYEVLASLTERIPRIYS